MHIKETIEYNNKIPENPDWLFPLLSTHPQ